VRDEQRNTIIIFLLVMFIGGAVLIAYGASRWGDYRMGSPVPQEMTVAELARDGPPANKHVRLRDCVPTDKYAAFGAKDSANYSRVWQSLVVPANPQGKRPHAVVLTSSDVLDEKRMGPLREPVIDGLIVSDRQSLTEEERNLLSQQGSGGDFSSPILIEVNGYPSRARVLGCLFGGIALVTVPLLVVGGLLARRALASRLENAPRDKPRRPRPAAPRRRPGDLE
jgi:hypothetical protein